MSKNTPPRLQSREADGKLHIDFVSDPLRPELGTAVGLIDMDGECLLLMAIDVGPGMPLDESRKLQIAGAIEHLYKSCRGITQPDRIVLPGRD